MRVGKAGDLDGFFSDIREGTRDLGAPAGRIPFKRVNQIRKGEQNHAVANPC